MSLTVNLSFFHAIRAVDLLTSEWRDGKDRLVLDYKRKRKDVSETKPALFPLCTALHCTALHCTALHCTALHCTALVAVPVAVRC
jgi:hypothetical protein